jgi:hypothetical protein
MGGFLGAIVTPLAGLEAGVAASVLNIMANISGSLWGGMIQRYYEASTKNDAATKAQILQDIEQHLQAESEKTDRLLVDLQYLIDKLAMLPALQISLGEQIAGQFQELLLAPRPIPADLSTHREFTRQVGNLFRMKGARVQEGYMLSDSDLSPAAQGQLKSRYARDYFGRLR